MGDMISKEQAIVHVDHTIGYFMGRSETSDGPGKLWNKQVAQTAEKVRDLIEEYVPDDRQDADVVPVGLVPVDTHYEVIKQRDDAVLRHAAATDISVKLADRLKAVETENVSLQKKVAAYSGVVEQRDAARNVADLLAEQVTDLTKRLAAEVERRTKNVQSAWASGRLQGRKEGIDLMQQCPAPSPNFWQKPAPPINLWGGQ